MLLDTTKISHVNFSGSAVFRSGAGSRSRSRGLRALTFVVAIRERGALRGRGRFGLPWAPTKPALRRAP